MVVLHPLCKALWRRHGVLMTNIKSLFCLLTLPTQSSINDAITTEKDPEQIDVVIIQNDFESETKKSKSNIVLTS